MIRGIVAENQKLPGCSARAERIAVAGGGQVLTQYGSYKSLLPLPNSGSKKELQCQGMQSIMGPIKRYPFQEVQQELRNVKGRFEAPLPEYTRGGEVSVLIGLQDISLDPVILGILPSGLGIYQCPFVDVWGSNIAFTGPHPSFQAPQPQENGALPAVSGTEYLSRPEKSGRKKKRFRRRPCLCLSSPGEGVGSTHRTFDTDSSSRINNIASNQRHSGYAWEQGASLDTRAGRLIE